MTTPKLQMPELVVGQAGKELTHNQALAVLDQLAQAVVVDKDLTAPPVSPVNGSMYIVAAGATGDWAGQSGKLAFWLTTVAEWTFITPADGWSVWVTDEAVRYERKAGSWVIVATGGGGGLTNLTEAKSTAAPNATVPAVSLSVTITDTNGDLALCPKGAGALLADIPNNATSGGNKRGTYAVDWQMSRSTAAQVASGDYSTIGGGDGNTASGSYSYVGSGNANTASALFSGVSCGTGNSATNNFSYVGGGQGNTAGSTHAIVSGGNNGLADGPGSSIQGGYDAWTRGIRGACAYSSGMFSIRGDCQRGDYMLRSQTSNATPARVAADGLNSTSQYQVTPPNASAYRFKGDVIARCNATGDCSAWEVSGVIKRGAAAVNTALVGTPTVTMIAQDSGAAAWALAVTADTTTGCLAITVTGAAATSIKWVTDVRTVEVVG